MDKAALETLEKHFANLVTRGSDLVNRIPREGRAQFVYWLPEDMIADASGWLASSANAIQTVSPAGSHFAEEGRRTLADSREENQNAAIPSRALPRMLGLLRAADADWKSGHLRRIEYVVAAATFDDFLEHADHHHRAGQFREASVLASAVLEDGIRKVCERQGVIWEGKTLFPRIDGLETAGILTKPEATRLKRWAETRNRADHAEWEKIDGKDVGAMISGIRDLIADHL